MKKLLISIIILFQAAWCLAQGQTAFPFKGGKDAMEQFFKDSLTVSPAIIKKGAIGTAVFKFTASENGSISKIIVYYADDAILAYPVIDALRKSDRKWAIPKDEKTHDFIIPFIFSADLPATDNEYLQKILYDNYRGRNPIIPNDQVPLDIATLLPPITVKYDITK